MKNEAGKEINQINLRIPSHNDGTTIWDMLKSHGIQSALFHSLHLEFGFVKTELITKFLKVFFSQVLDMEQFTRMFDSFKRLNIEANFASGAYLKEFPKLQLIKEAPPTEKNPISDFILSSGL